MQFGICNLSIIPVRKSAGHTSEMVSQLLFGETFEILNREDSWVQVQMHTDQYTGWIHQLQYLSLEESELDLLNIHEKVLLNNLYSSVTGQMNGNCLPLLMGSTFPKPSDQHFFNFANESYVFKGDYFSTLPLKEQIVINAQLYLGAPYLWGGRTHFGIDCSGFTQIVYKLAGFSLPRDASQQSLEGETLSFLTEAVPGDLLFFDNQEGNIIHVGILYNSDKIIHASGNVRIDSIDHQGIYNENLQKYTHKLRLIKKMV